MSLEFRRTDESLYDKHTDGFRLDAVAHDPDTNQSLGSYEGREIIADGESLDIDELHGLAHYEATGGAEGVQP
jgi:hypothetical protein